MAFVLIFKPQKHSISALAVYVIGEEEGNKQVLLKEGVSRPGKTLVPRTERGDEIPPRIWTEGGRPVPPRGVQCVEADCPVPRCSALPLASGARRGGSRPSQGTRFSFSESPELSKREISASSCAVFFLEFFCCLVKCYSAPDAHPAPGLIKAPSPQGGERRSRPRHAGRSVVAGSGVPVTRLAAQHAPRNRNTQTALWGDCRFLRCKYSAVAGCTPPA